MNRFRPVPTAALAMTLLLAGPAALAATAPRDSALTTLPAVTVSGDEAEPPGPDRTRLTAAEIAGEDPGSLADVGALIPSTHVATNSRGESQLMIRGAPERHVQAFLDDIPLNLPWDERADLATVPIVGTGGVTATRGLTTLLAGPGVLAGRIDLRAPDLHAAARRNRIVFAAGEHGAGRTVLQHNDRSGSWEYLGATGWQGRNAFNLPRDVVERDGADRRLNSDLSQYSVLLRGVRPVAGVGRLKLLATYWTAVKGVPAELNLGDEARFWRYPLRRRGLFGATLERPLDDAGNWDLSATLSADFFSQEIDPRGPDAWDTPLLAGQDYEKNWDRTGYSRVRLTRWLGPLARVSLQANARYTHHREVLTVGGPLRDYSQWLNALVAEAEFHPVDGWRLRLGAGLDYRATPEAGVLPHNAAGVEPAWNVRLTRPLAGRSALYAAASARSRAPSLRELYSGALGRFVPNPDLNPERQTLYEVGYSRVTRRWRLEAAAFLLTLADGIEKVALGNPERQFRRLNRTRIRVPGLELAGRWRWTRNLALTWQHTVLAARVGQDGAFTAPAEDRPDYLSRVGLRWLPPSGPGALVAATITGARWSADTTAPAGRRRLPPGVVWAARLQWRLTTAHRTVIAHLRLDNVFDQRVDDQVGLPNPGRTLSGGLTLDF